MAEKAVGLPNIDILGPGSLGLLVATRLVRGGQRIRLLGRSVASSEGAQSEEISKSTHEVLRSHVDRRGVAHGETARVAYSGPSISSGSSVHSIPYFSSDQPEIASVERLLVCVKGYQLANALLSLRDLLSPSATVLLLGNGLGLVEKAREILPGVAIGAAVTSYGAQRLSTSGAEADLAVSETGIGWVDIGRGSVWIEAFRSGGFQVREHDSDELEIAIWTKAIVNCSLNSLAAILGLSNGDLLECRSFCLVSKVAEEAAEVALRRLASDTDRSDSSSSESAESNRADLARLIWSKESWSGRVATIARATAKNRCSMLSDIDSGRPTEIDELNGRIVAWGESLGVPTPINRRLVEWVRARERGEAIDGRGLLDTLITD